MHGPGHAVLCLHHNQGVQAEEGEVSDVLMIRSCRPEMGMYQAKALESAGRPSEVRDVRDEDPLVVAEDDVGDKPPPVNEDSYLTTELF
ncbi:MAG: hypothetical protein K6360_02470 [Deltaproteobacteria bacterium]